MGFFAWLLGSGMPSGRFGMAKVRQPGEWVIATEQLEVVGIHHRKDQAKAFAKAAYQADKKGKPYGLSLMLEPNNPHDKNAIMVFGHVEEKEWFLGYVDSDTAAEVHEDLLSKGITIGVQLQYIYVGKGGYIDIKMVILAPKGNSLSSRQRRKTKLPT